jgi:hypothetical protein
MRVFLAGLIGGIVVFAWGAVAHMALGIGDMGMKAPTNEAAVLSALKDGLPSEGVYFLPYLDPAKMQDAEATKAYSAHALTSPFAYVVYQPQGLDPMDMSRNLPTQFISDTLSALVVAFVLALGNFSFSRRVLIAGALGLFAWLTISVPYWNWYRFPLDLTVANLIEQVVGWLLGGAAIAWWLGRARR